MFFSNQICISQEHGVATIWRMATVGRRGPAKKIPRRAILSVEIGPACAKIIEPGAPLALRLSANLLYGVSRVYQAQCGYVLDDAEKVQEKIRMVARQLVSLVREAELQAGVPSAREQNMVPNDPRFSIDDLPEICLDIDMDGMDEDSQGSRNRYSQLSPLDPLGIDFGMGSSQIGGLPFGFGGSSQGGTPLAGGIRGSQSSLLPSQKARDGSVEILFGNDEPLDPLGSDFDFGFDADGNLIEGLEPDLPPLPPQDDLLQGLEDFLREQGPGNQQGAQRQSSQPREPEQEDVVMFQDDLEQVEGTQGDQAGQVDQAGGESSLNQPQEEGEKLADGHDDQEQAVADGEDPAPPRHRRARQGKNFNDEVRELRKAEMTAWTDTYVERNQVLNLDRAGRTSAAKSRHNAYMWTFGLGIGNVGARTGIPGADSPLALYFSGDALMSRVLGVPSIDHLRAASPAGPEEEEENEEQDRDRGGRDGTDPQRRRSADEAFGEDERAASSSRNVRQKTDEMEPAAGGQEELPMLGNEEEGTMQVGMEQATPRPADHPSSSNMPWSRAGSVAPGSSLKSGVASARRDARQGGGGGGSQLQSQVGSDFVRIPSEGVNPLPSDDMGGGDFQPMGAQRSSSPPHEAGSQERGQEEDSQWLRDIECDEFLVFVAREAGLSGVQDNNDEEDAEAEEGPGTIPTKTWVSFEKVAIPQVHNKVVAAQAFYHTLVLATKDRISVRQENSSGDFGEIFIGVGKTDVESAIRHAELKEHDDGAGGGGGGGADDDAAQRNVDLPSSPPRHQPAAVAAGDEHERKPARSDDEVMEDVQQAEVEHHVEYDPVEDDEIMEDIDASSGDDE